MVIIELLLLIVGIYLAFNVLIGVLYYLPKYIITEGSVNSLKELLVLCTFPVIGLGIWQYRRNAKCSQIDPYPKNFYIWKYMIRINTVFLIFFGVIFILYIFLLFGLFGSSFDICAPSDEIKPLGIDATVDVVISLLCVLVFEGLTVILVIFSVIAFILTEVLLFIALILIPIIIKKIISRRAKFLIFNSQTLD